jgi:hypothetical protein
MKTNEEKFRLLWGELARTGRIEKDITWRRLKLGKDRSGNYCSACDETMIRAEVKWIEMQDCSKCPIRWGRANCCEYGTLFERWDKSPDPAERKQLALKISKMKWHKKVVK